MILKVSGQISLYWKDSCDCRIENQVIGNYGTDM